VLDIEGLCPLWRASPDAKADTRAAQNAMAQKFGDLRVNTDLLFRTAGKFELLGRMLPKVCTLPGSYAALLNVGAK
jgi:hypothetical protein